MSGLVVGWDGNINELEGSVGVGEGDNSGLGQQRFKAVFLLPDALSSPLPISRNTLFPGNPLNLFPQEKQHSRDVNVGSLSDSLVVDSGVGDNDNSRLLERLGDVVGEVTWSESSGNGLGTGETSELQDSSVTVWSGRDDTDVVGVVDGGEDSGSKDEFLPGLADVQDVDT